jgi:hypothetical protein
MDEFKIPVNDAIVEFDKHLQANPRTILSSKFGDGKSYFLQQVKEDKDLQEKYEFLTVYPVNYQVIGNKDIFELLKRDILFQLMIHGMISDSVQITEKEAIAWFVSNNGISLVADLIPYFVSTGLGSSECHAVLLAMKGLELFKSVKTQFEKFKKSKVKTDSDMINVFLDKIEESSSIYECDMITQIIQKTIKDYKDRENKQVVLFIEDMDRIDPAHLFRILNVLSAHMDYGYKYAVKPNESLIGNKFELDNIVLVIDFDNLRKIYHHLYGIETDFEGYISKFLSSLPFKYSLEKLKYDYIINKIFKITSIPSTVLEKLLKEEISNPSIREIVQSFNIEKQIPILPMVTVEYHEVLIDTSILKLMAIMRRLKMNDDVIQERVMGIRKFDDDLFYRLVCPYLFLEENAKNNTINRSIIAPYKDYSKVRLDIKLDIKKGIVSLGPCYSCSSDAVETDFEKCIYGMLDYIAR